MSTATPPRPMPPRPAPSRPRPSSGGARASVGLDPFRVLRRHVLVLMAAGVLGGGLGGAMFFLLLSVFPLSTGQVLFTVRSGLNDAGDVGTQDSMSDEAVYLIAKTELVLAVGRDVLTNAVGDPDVQTKTEWFQRNYVDDQGSVLVAEAVDDLVDDLKVGVVRGTQLFEIKWSTHHGPDVPIVLNAVANAYMEKRKALDNQTYNKNLELFNRQLAQTNLEIQDLDQEIEAFIIDADITSLEDPRYHELAMSMKAMVAQIAGTNHELSFAQSGYLQTAAKLEGKMEPSAADILEAELDFAVASHIRVVENMKFQLRVARDKFREDHPSLVQAESLLRAASAERLAKTEEIVQRNLNARLKSFTNAMETYQLALERLEEENEAKGEQLTELTAQQSSYEALREQRDHLENARDSDRQLIKEIQLMRLRADADRVAIAQAARTPRERSFPKIEIIVPLCTLLVVGVCVGIIFLREMTDQRIKSASDLSVVPGAHVLGVIPDLEEDPTKCEAAELVIRRHPTSVLAESYRQACVPCAKAIDRAGHQTIVLVGGLPGAGTTTVTSNLAAAAAASGRRVLVVDANFRRPRLGSVMGVENDAPGLGDVLAGNCSVAEAVVESEWGVHVMPAGSPAHRIVDRLNSEKFDSLVAELRGEYEIILFDAAPAVVAGDALVLAHRLDAAVLIVRANKEQRGLVSRLISQIVDAHCDLLGIVLNRPLVTAGGYFKRNFAQMAEYTFQGASDSDGDGDSKPAAKA